ncbi:MAG: SH3 domain-containing protein [Christensenellales bacterium]|nr:SH3 domain-containing protein [Christensenellales bacterium]
MVFSKFLAFTATLILCTGILSVFAPTAAAESEYAIGIDLTNQIVTVYRSDGTVVRQMLCSAGKHNFTPVGTFTLPKSNHSDEREEWYYFDFYQCWAKYATRIYKGILFHSVPYSQKKESTVDQEGLALLGEPASHGCIRLLWQDAKFIAENCLPGTVCKIYYSDDPDPDLKEILRESSYTLESGLTHNEFLGIPEEPGALGRFSSGQEVVELQTRLRTLGYYAADIDGEYRGTTVTAVKRVQTALNMEADGIASVALQEIIFSSDVPCAMDVPLSEGSTGPAVNNLQSSLRALKLYDEELDGIYDLAVVDAVRLFQQAYGYPTDGAASPEVQKAIYYEAGKLTSLYTMDSGYTLETASDVSQIAVVDSSVGVRIRAKASTESEAVGRVTNGMELALLEKGEYWSKIQTSEATGYIKNVFLKFTERTVTRLTYTSLDDGEVHTIGHTAEEYAAGATFPSIRFATYLASGGSLEDYEGLADYATVATGDDSIRLNLREAPNSDANVVAELANGTNMHVLLRSAEWTLVSTEQGDGYLLNEYLEYWSGPNDALGVVIDESVGENFAAGGETVFASVLAPEEGNADVFDLDSPDANKIGYLPHGTQVIVLYSDNDWSLIDWNGNQGYMKSDHLYLHLADDIEA